MRSLSDYQTSENIAPTVTIDESISVKTLGQSMSSTQYLVAYDDKEIVVETSSKPPSLVNTTTSNSDNVATTSNHNTLFNTIRSPLPVTPSPDSTPAPKQTVTNSPMLIFAATTQLVREVRSVSNSTKTFERN